MKIKHRLQQLIARRPTHAKDVYVTVFNNTTEYSPVNFSFYLSDFDEFQSNPVLDYDLDSENKGEGKLSLGFNI